MVKVCAAVLAENVKVEAAPPVNVSPELHVQLPYTRNPTAEDEVMV